MTRLNLVATELDHLYVIGKIWDEIEERYFSVIGYEFHDTPGFFQFYEIGSNGHFRKRPQHEQGDSIAPISFEIFEQLS